jgi:hypothetical protein
MLTDKFAGINPGDRLADPGKTNLFNTIAIFLNSGAGTGISNVNFNDLRTEALLNGLVRLGTDGNKAIKNYIVANLGLSQVKQEIFFATFSKWAIADQARAMVVKKVLASSAPAFTEKLKYQLKSQLVFAALDDDIIKVVNANEPTWTGTQPTGFKYFYFKKKATCSFSK